jgi:hypothetical protein
LAFLNEKKSKVAPNTLWRICLMLILTLLTYYNIKLSDYGLLTPFLKQNVIGYKSKKVKIFVKENMDKFFLITLDNSFLKNIFLFIY